MKRYALFGYYYYYPGGGWSDYVQSFEIGEEAIARGKFLHGFKGKPWTADTPAMAGRDFYEVIDLQIGNEIWASS